VLFCDFLNRAELASDHLPQDLLYVLTLYVEALSNAIRATGGTLSYVDPDSICALFGRESGTTRAARQALQAGGAIDKVISELNERLGRQWDCKVRISVSIHAGRAVVGEIGSPEPVAVMAVGEATDVANALRKAASAHGKAFAISEQVYEAAGLDPPSQDKVVVHSNGSESSITAFLSVSAPALPPGMQPRMRKPPAALQRLWSGSRS
jgi:adenylate cyclase